MNEVAVQKNNALLNLVMQKTGVKTDTALARVLETKAPIICRIRKGKLNLSPNLLIHIHEITELSFKDIRAMLAAETPAVDEVAAAA